MGKKQILNPEQKQKKITALQKAREALKLKRQQKKNKTPDVEQAPEQVPEQAPEQVPEQVPEQTPDIDQAPEQEQPEIKPKLKIKKPKIQELEDETLPSVPKPKPNKSLFNLDDDDVEEIIIRRKKKKSNKPKKVIIQESESESEEEHKPVKKIKRTTRINPIEYSQTSADAYKSLISRFQL